MLRVSFFFSFFLFFALYYSHVRRQRINRLTSSSSKNNHELPMRFPDAFARKINPGDTEISMSSRVFFSASHALTAKEKSLGKA
jgi:hypothetical protein